MDNLCMLLLNVTPLPFFFCHKKRPSVLSVNYLKRVGHALKEVSGMHVMFWIISYKTTLTRYVSSINSDADAATID